MHMEFSAMEEDFAVRKIEKNMMALFPRPPLYGHITVDEVDGELVDVPTNPDWVKITKIPGHPSVHIKEEHPVGQCQLESSESAFIHKNESTWRMFYNTWYTRGLTESMMSLAANYDNWSWVSKAAGGVVSVADAMKTWLRHLSPSWTPAEECIVKYSRFKNWRKSPVRAFAWHPHATKLAVATEKDDVMVYMGDSALVPKLCNRHQKNVTDLAWQPLSSSVLVVACEKCLILWTIEPNSLVSRPSTKCMQVVDSQSVSPVLSLAWNPDGSVLLFGSPHSSAIMACDVTGQRLMNLRKTSSGGIALLRWSPDGQRVFSAAPIPCFRIWSASCWHSDKWTQANGRCTAACWSPCGQRLLFAMAEDTRLHSITISKGFLGPEGSQLQERFASSILANLEPGHLYSEQADHWCLGGFVHDMVWDETGQRLAILFKDEPGTTNDYVAVFRTTLYPNLELTPVGFVKGLDDETPQYICFKGGCTDRALLTVVWSSGRVGYVPMYFSKPPASAASQMEEEAITVSRSLFSSDMMNVS